MFIFRLLSRRFKAAGDEVRKNSDLLGDGVTVEAAALAVTAGVLVGGSVDFSVDAVAGVLIGACLFFSRSLFAKIAAIALSTAFFGVVLMLLSVGV